MQYSAALDLSGDEAALAVAENPGKVIIEQFRPMTGRNSAILVPWVIDSLNQVKLTLDDISAWTVGAGPGSFTGMRLVAAMIEGLVLGHDKKSRCVPTAMALAANTKPGQKTAVIFDGRNHELLLFGVTSDSSGLLKKYGEDMVVNSEKAVDILHHSEYDNISAMQKDAPAFEKILPANILSRIKYHEHVPISELLKPHNCEWNNNLTDLCYIRPAVFPRNK